MPVARILEILRYLVTGAMSVALNLIIIVTLTEYAGFHYLLSICVCFVTVTFVSFAINRIWTFRKHGGGAPSDLLRYVVVTLIQVPLSLGACSFCVEWLHLSYPVAVVLVAIVCAPTSYLLHRSWSFGLQRLGGRA